MPYEREISRQHKALFVFLLDQSFSMEEPLGSSQNRKMDELATAINSLLQNLVIQCTRTEGVRDYLDVAVIGYRTDQEANPIIESPLIKDELRQQPVVSIVDIATHSEIEKRQQSYFDPDLGAEQVSEIEFPLWVRPFAEGGTPMCWALHRAREVVEQWLADPKNKDSFPPIVIHITDGESTDQGDPLQYAEALTDLETSDGRVLLFNCHLSMTKADPFLFADSGEILPDEYARLLYKMSSVFPERMYNMLLAEGYQKQPGVRGMAFNADMVSLIKFLDFGTRVAQQLR